jgi:hypothetical protein
MVTYDRAGRRRKTIKRYPATLHPDHIRCDAKAGAQACSMGASQPALVHESYRSLHKYPFLVTAKQVVVGRGGMIALPCGTFGLFASCEAVKWGVPASEATVSSVAACRNDGEDCPYPKLDRVFVMTQYDDTQIGQFILEALPKLVYHLDFLRANPDVRIHFGFSKLPELPSFVLPQLIFRWLGLEGRLVNGTVFAREAWLPREGGCQDSGYNAWETVTMRDRLLAMAGVDQSAPVSQPSVVVLRRGASPYTKNQGDYKYRRWPRKDFPRMLSELRRLLPRHRLDIFSDLNLTLMGCRECQMHMFYEADLVIGIHGAGLTNTVSEELHSCIL